MGYYTNFDLKVIKGEDKEIDYVSEIGDANSYGDDWDNGLIKWYDTHEDMLQYSLKYPDTTFQLTGEGEESGDFWRNYYNNGKCQQTKGEVIYEEFDEFKLK